MDFRHEWKIEINAADLLALRSLPFRRARDAHGRGPPVPFLRRDMIVRANRSRASAVNHLEIEGAGLVFGR